MAKQTLSLTKIKKLSKIRAKVMTLLDNQDDIQ